MPTLTVSRARRAPCPFALLIAVVSVLGCTKPKANRMWGGGLPFIADVNGDGVEDMISFGSEITALDGRTLVPLWQRADLDVYVPNARRIAAVAGRSFVVTKGRSLEILDLASGQTRRSVPTSDLISGLCADGDRVWVTQIDVVCGLLDVGAGTLDRAAAQPPACAPIKPGRNAACDYASARCEGTYPSMNMTLTDAATVVAVEFKQPGTPEVSVVVRDARGQEQARTLLDAEGRRVVAVDLAGHRLFLKQSGKVTAVDARTGAVAWTVRCAGDGPYLRATPSRLYVECDGPRNYKRLRVVDHDAQPLADFGPP
jgi:hypothetical protein